MTRAMGKAWSSRKLIKLSIPLFQRASPEEQRQTVIHEACHIIADYIAGRRVVHGEPWKSCMIKCGVPATRCHNVDRTGLRRKTTRYKCVCGCVEGIVVSAIIATKMRRRGLTYKCRRCRMFISLPIAVVS